MFQFIAVGIIGGTFLIAIGFLAAPGWKYAAIGLFYCNLLGLAGYFIAGLSRVTPTLPRILLGASSSSLAIGTTPALIYAAGEYSGDVLIDIPGMALWHGPINGIGFTLCALLGWVTAQGTGTGGATECRPLRTGPVLTEGLPTKRGGRQDAPETRRNDRTTDPVELPG